MLECEYRKNNSCLIANQLYGLSTECTDTACSVCSNIINPKTINEVTISLAISGARKNKEQDEVSKLLSNYGYLLKRVSGNNKTLLKQIIDGNGVGSQLWNLLIRLDIKHKSDCPCLIWAERMNNWGPDGCRLARKEIVEHMTNSAKNYGWGDLAKATAKAITTGVAFKINPLDIYGSLLDEAIRLAEEAELKKNC